MQAALEIRRIATEDTLQLRRDVLYPSATLAGVRVDHDDDGLHFGLFEQGWQVGVVSLFPQGPAAQFRKLAITPACQGKGYGSLLVDYMAQLCRRENIPLLWCNARDSAEGFYDKLGFTRTGNRFTRDNIIFQKMELDLEKYFRSPQSRTLENTRSQQSQGPVQAANGFTIIPAIDIIDGKCVRLTQGDYAQQKVYNEHPLEVAKAFENAGVRRLHLVDLDGAKKGAVVNWKVLEAVAGKTGLVVDFGGGIKQRRDLEIVFESGAALATIGSIAVKEPELFFSWVKEYGPEKIFLGADVKDEKIAVGGWLETTGLSVLDFLEANVRQGVRHIFCTDIAKDGLLQGPSIPLYKKILERFNNIDFVASGGVSNIADVHALQQAGCSGVIIGKAIYEGRISMDELKTFFK